MCRHLNLILLALSAALCGCATTPYKQVAVENLSDAQLIEELDACAKGVGKSINRAQYLMATMPDPAYVMTSSSTCFSGSSTTSISAYAMPAGYGRRLNGTASSQFVGTAHTQYQYTDANAMARGMQGLAVAIASSQAAAFRSRGTAVLTEIESRIEKRRAETQAVIDGFFSDHPDAASKPNLIAAILPWVTSSGAAKTPREALEKARDMALSIPRGEGLNGRWFGLFSQATTLPDGQTVNFSQFFRVTMEQTGEKVRGAGEIGSGEKLEISGRIVDGAFTGLVANTTDAINSKFSGTAADSQIVVSFEGLGMNQSVKGTATLFR